MIRVLVFFLAGNRYSLSVSPSIVPGGELTASGSRFRGISEASGGSGVQNSSSNYPLVQLLSLGNEQTLFLPVNRIAGWSDSSFTSAPITLMTTSSSGFPIGHALVTVFTNRIPSQSPVGLGATATPTPTPTPGPIQLQGKGKRVAGINTSRLKWRGATSANIDVYRDGVVIATTPNDGLYDDSTGTTGQASFTYKVCEAGTQTCSNSVTVNFPP